MPTVSRVSCSLAFCLLCFAACEERATDELATQAVASQVEGIDAALLAALPEGVTVEAVEQGRQLYVVCSVCHGLEAEGTQLGPSLRAPDWIHISGEIEEIEEIVRSGVGTPAVYPIPMPVMGGGNFDDQQLRALATYIHLLGRGAR